ncbi:bifunctional DNA-formamidopyrimidine glycosylase/DNA-(apurinic or apyrimidinic site) lyase [Nitratireductor sp. CH_MIT9313-5]|uniref:bifunctional DNA-formamidopyrimidine glycosylase/DNA-(apurinic or apyrimidinic site) lyase n=1 Tax=Nitratireductor sp. CH_MIT9313-5 TaxID=3107764 RepID=UPI003008F0A1
MPELPEVETVRRGLEPAMQGARIERLELRRPDLRFPFPEGLAQSVAGQKISALGRRAKYLLIHLENGQVLICHLGMSGSFRVEYGDGAETPGQFHIARSRDQKHDHVIFHLRSAGQEPLRVVYNDPRRFGFMLSTSGADLHDHPLLAHLGLEPTGNALSAEALATMFANRSTSLKAALMDQSLISGLGNIYVCEALWRAGLSPRRKASTLVTRAGQPTPRAARLAQAIRAVIAEAIASGGSTLRDHAQTDGSLGYFQHSFSVYDREAVACPRAQCTGTVKRVVQNGRSTFYCPSCQR